MNNSLDLRVLSFKDELDYEAGLLSLIFLSEIEKHMDQIGMNKTDLAKKLNTSKSYLTQLWRGDKKLNMAMIARIQLALNIKFDIALKQI